VAFEQVYRKEPGATGDERASVVWHIRAPLKRSMRPITLR
jgi:hypothetical protein